MDQADTDHWIAIYKRFRVYLRFLVGGLLLLSFVAFFDGVDHVSRQGEAYQVAVDIILEEQGKGALRMPISALYKKILDDSPDRALTSTLTGALPGRITVDLSEIKPLYRKYVRLRDTSDEEVFYIWTTKVTLPIYVSAMMFGSLLLVIAMIWPLVAIRKLHSRLAASAEPGGLVQQELNSLFYPRVTTHYGKRWRLHVLSCMFGIFILAAATPFLFVSARNTLGPDLSLEIDGEGQVFPRDDDPKESHLAPRHDNEIALTMAVVEGLILAAAAVVTGIALSIPAGAGGPDETLKSEQELPPAEDAV